MKLDRVTLTGADDTVKPEDLYAISKEFPFVEWGILFGAGEDGSPRFPSSKWLQRLSDTAPADVKLCAHLCGMYVKYTFGGHDLLTEAPQFQRAQLNTHGTPLKYYHNDRTTIADNLKKMLQSWKGQFIFQADGVNEKTIKKWVKDGLGVPLFDTSSGAGVTPQQLGEAWPSVWGSTYCGYAGGLGPDNVVAQLEGPILEAVGDGHIWIDMETRVRTRTLGDSIFDLDKCRDVLQKVAPYING